MSFDALETSRYGGKPYELFRFTMGAQSWQYTSGEISRTHPTHGIFAPEVIDHTEVTYSGESSSGTITVNLPISNAVAALFVSFIPPDPVWLTIFAGHDGDAEIVTRFRGKIAKAEFSKNCALTILPEASSIRKKIPSMVYQQPCNRMLYSASCGASLTGNQWSFEVANVSADGLTVGVNPGAGASAAYVAYWQTAYSPTADADGPPSLAWGYMVSADGHRMMIGQHTNWYTMVLKAAVPGLNAGDVVTVVRGCRRTTRHCKHFGRLQVFNGFDQFPSKNPFNGVL